MSTKLSDWTALHISGPDSREFLQGQLTCDVREVSARRASFGALCTPKGRMISNFYLTQAHAEQEDTLLMLLPQSVAEPTLTTLQKYIVFSKAEIRLDKDIFFAGVLNPDRADLQSLGLAESDSKAARLSTQHFAAGQLLWVESGPEIVRALILQTGEAAPLESCTAQQWAAADIRAGIAFVQAETSDSLLPQMLNMDYIDGINFEKGCYTGQEVVARAHYRGKVKRRMALLAASADKAPLAGEELHDAASDQRVGTLVAAVSTDKEVLALGVLSDDELTNVTCAGLQFKKLELPYL